MRKLAFWLGGAVALYAFLGFLVAPLVVQRQIEELLGEQLGRKVSIERVRINPFTLSASIQDLSLKERDGTTTAFGFERLDVDVAWSSLFRRGAIVEAVHLTKPQVRAVRLADGGYSFQDIIDRLTAGPPAPPGPAPRFAVYNIQVSDGRVEFYDEPEKAQHVVTDLQVGLPFVSSLPAEIDIVVAPRLSAKVNGTPFEIAGETLPFRDRHVTTVRIDIDDLELGKYLNYSPVPLRIRVPSGKLNTRLVLSSTAVPGNRLDTLNLSGTASLERLRIQQADGKPLVALARLSVDLGGLDLLRRRVTFTSVRLDAPEVDLAREKDGSINLLAAFPKRRDSAPSKQESGPPFIFMVEQIALSRGRLRFVDRTPEKPVAVTVDDLSLYVEGLGNTPENNATVKSGGRIGRAQLETTGRLALLPGGVALDAKTSAREIDLKPLSPYSVMYAGYTIEKGTLSLRHTAKLDGRTLSTENNIRLDQFTFGEKVDSPTATKLPVALAVSVLKDLNGVITVDLPISASLDDPDAGGGRIIAREAGGLIGRTAAKPFAALGSLVGGGEELAYVEFAPGSAALDAAGEEKLRKLARALQQRPGLGLDVSGRVDPEMDGAALKRVNPSELAALARSRAQTARDWLVQTGKVSADRVTLVQTEGNKATRVDFTLK